MTASLYRKYNAFSNRENAQTEQKHCILPLPMDKLIVVLHVSIFRATNVALKIVCRRHVRLRVF